MTGRLGILCLPGRGHLYPSAALGRCLKKRGHEIVLFNRLVARAISERSGFEFYSLPDQPRPLLRLSAKACTTHLGPNTIDVMYAHASAVLNQAEVFQRAKVDGLLIDQADLASGSIADLLHIPFINLSFMPPVYLSCDSAPCIFRWKPDASICSERRNTRGNALLSRLLKPVLDLVNSYRQLWKMREIQQVNDLFSDRAIVTQLPEVFDFPRRIKPKALFHTGLFVDQLNLTSGDFPWHRLDGRPLVYASLGTVRNDSRRLFQIIAEACANLEAQLLISLGGMALFPEDLGPLPGKPIVLHYCRQWEVLAKAKPKLTITHAGANTTLESLYHGIPLLAIPITDDQPGVAARIEFAGVGETVPLREISVNRLREGIHRVYHDPKYSFSAGRMGVEFRKIEGLERAADIVERTLL